MAWLTVADLGWLLDEHARQYAGLRESGAVTFYLDEVQTVPGWEGLVRRLVDSRNIELFVSGPSARLVSREVATSLRGRAMEVLVFPFSFREALRYADAEPNDVVQCRNRWLNQMGLISVRSEVELRSPVDQVLDGPFGSNN